MKVIMFLADFNARLRLQAKKLVDLDSHIPIQFNRLNLDSLIGDMDPKLWSAICILTQSY